MKGIFDSHAHYDDEKFDADRDIIIPSLPSKGVYAVVNAATNLENSKICIDFSEKYSHFFAAVGIHPEDANGVREDYISILRELAKHKKVVAIGEIGLDYYYDTVPRDIQKSIFENQILLANELDLPVIIHDREAHGDMYEILRRTTPKKGVMHCFSGSVELADETVKLGLYIGLGGAVTFKNAKTPVEVAAHIPLERLLLETDAPYMAPVPFRGKRCDSTMIEYVAEKIAVIRNITKEAVINAAAENAEKLFGLSL